MPDNALTTCLWFNTEAEEAATFYTGDPDGEKTGRVMQAMFGMTKFDVAALERAYAGA